MIKPVAINMDLYDYNNMRNGDIKMSYKHPKYFTQNIPSTQKNTEFLIDLLEDLLKSDTLTKSQKNKLECILDSSFNQVEILPKKDYHNCLPFST